MDTQIFANMSPYLSWLLSGFRKGYNAQHALMRAIEKWKACLDNGGKIGAVFMELSKAFDCIRHDLLIAKLHASLLNGVPYVPYVPSCLRCWRALVPSCPRAQIFGVPSCHRCWRALVPACPNFRRALVPSMLACPRALGPSCPNFWRALVPSMLACPRARVPIFSACPRA